MIDRVATAKRARGENFVMAANPWINRRENQRGGNLEMIRSAKLWHCKQTLCNTFRGCSLDCEFVEERLEGEIEPAVEAEKEGCAMMIRGANGSCPHLI